MESLGQNENVKESKQQSLPRVTDFVQTNYKSQTTEKTNKPSEGELTEQAQQSERDARNSDNLNFASEVSVSFHQTKFPQTTINESIEKKPLLNSKIVSKDYQEFTQNEIIGLNSCPRCSLSDIYDSFEEICKNCDSTDIHKSRSVEQSLFGNLKHDKIEASATGVHFLRMEQIDETVNSEISSPKEYGQTSSPWLQQIVAGNLELQESTSHKRLTYGTNKPIFSIKLETILDDAKQDQQISNRVSKDQHEAKNQVHDDRVVSETLPLMPILPKSNFEFRLPPKCPLEDITFVQLRKFIQNPETTSDMGLGFDMVDAKSREKRLMKQQRDGLNINAPVVNKGPGFSMGPPPSKEITQIIVDPQLPKIDETTTIITNIVFTRDPQVLIAGTCTADQLEVFQHHNYLDIKSLVKKRELLADEDQSPRARAALRIQRNKKQQFEAQVFRLSGPEDRTLLFESRFEGGNLYLAQKVSDTEYNLLMQNDINTSGHTQWFYFRVLNTKAKSAVKFNIMNYSKPDSLFNFGMKVSVYSEKSAIKDKVSWYKSGDNIKYSQNGIKKEPEVAWSKQYYTLTFTHTFKYDHDCVYFAYSVPYTYTDLRNDLHEIEQNEARAANVSRKTLCKTLAGEDCEYLTITSRENLEDFNRRKGVVLTARVHPGETVGSWMMRGLLFFLTDPENEEAKLLRQNFVFKIIPMLNPDGVINGNYRTSLAGCDLNRRWKNPSKMIHPTIYHVKKMIKQVQQERGLLLFCDLHGHSRKQNVFMYGCNKKDNPQFCRIFPFMLSKLNPYFSFQNSRFGMQKSKEATARIALFKELKNVPCIYTMESSFAGIDFGKQKGMHLTTAMLETLGKDLCRTLLIYENIFVPSELQNEFAQKKQTMPLGLKVFAEDEKQNSQVLNMTQMLIQELTENKVLLKLGEGNSSSGSDSAPSEDNLNPIELLKNLPIADKTLKQKIKQQQQEKIDAKKPTQNNNSTKPKPPVIVQPAKRAVSPKKPETQQQPISTAIKLVEVKQVPKLEVSSAEPPKVADSKIDPLTGKPKPKPEMRDAITQTDRSDYAIIKQKALRAKQEEMRLLEQQQQGIKRQSISQFGAQTQSSNNMKAPYQQNPFLFQNQPQKSPVNSQLQGASGLNQPNRNNQVFASSINQQNQGGKLIQVSGMTSIHGGKLTQRQPVAEMNQMFDSKKMRTVVQNSFVQDQSQEPEFIRNYQANVYNSQKVSQHRIATLPDQITSQQSLIMQDSDAISRHMKLMQQTKSKVTANTKMSLSNPTSVHRQPVYQTNQTLPNQPYVGQQPTMMNITMNFNIQQNSERQVMKDPVMTNYLSQPYQTNTSRPQQMNQQVLLIQGIQQPQSNFEIKVMTGSGNAQMGTRTQRQSHMNDDLGIGVSLGNVGQQISTNPQIFTTNPSQMQTRQSAEISASGVTTRARRDLPQTNQIATAGQFQNKNDTNIKGSSSLSRLQSSGLSQVANTPGKVSLKQQRVASDKNTPQ